MKYYEEYKGFSNEELVVLAQAGNRAARDYLVLKNDRMISTILGKYTRHYNTDMYRELYNEAVTGMLRAIDGFDSTKGFKFTTYAWEYTQGAVLLAMRRSSEGKCFRIGREQKKAFIDIMEAEDRLRQTLMREPTTEDIAKELGKTRQEVEYLINLNSNHSSLNEVIFESNKGSDGDIYVQDKVEDENSISEDQIINNTLLREAISQLDPKRQKILKMIYVDGYPQHEIAKKLGTSQCYISNELRASIKILRRILTGEFEKPVEQRDLNFAKGKSVKIRCRETGDIFESMKEASEAYGVSHSNISRCVNGKVYSAGKHPVTHEKLTWERVNYDEQFSD